jgi:hypothetical protein
MDERGRIVVVAAGFALWIGGRCVAAARWADVRTLRGVRPSTATAAADALAVRVELLDGTLIELREEAPGFDLFLDRASASLSGLRPFREWHPALADGTAPADGLVFFERPGRRPPPPRRSAT